MNSAEMLKGHLDGLLLAVLADGSLHGYAVVERLRDRSEGQVDLPSGTIYPALHRLERTGLVTSEWSVERGRRRRTYQLTRAGRRALEEHRQGWRRFTTTVDRILSEPT
jgi:PadR family transcriptional regulator, regulatory protein PadR